MDTSERGFGNAAENNSRFFPTHEKNALKLSGVIEIEIREHDLKI